LVVEFIGKPPPKASGSRPRPKPARSVEKGKERARGGVSGVERLVYLEELAKAEAQMRMIEDRVAGIRAKLED
jgi:hypothetical protein